MTPKEEEALLKVFKKCPHYGHNLNLERLFWLGLGISIGVSVGFYAFWYLLLRHVATIITGG